MATMDVLDATGTSVAVEKPLAPGSATDAASRPVAFSTEGKAQLGAVTETAPATDTASSGLNGRLQRIAQRITSMIALLPAALGAGGGLKVQVYNAAGTAVDPVAAVSGGVPVINAGLEYEAVAASQTNQVIGATGAAGDYMSHVIVSPATAGCGVVTIYDNATALVSFPGGGTTALSNLIPFVIPVGIISTSGAWKITTGANVSCVAVGNFT